MEYLTLHHITNIFINKLFDIILNSYIIYVIANKYVKII